MFSQYGLENAIKYLQQLFPNYKVLNIAPVITNSGAGLGQNIAWFYYGTIQTDNFAAAFAIDFPLNDFTSTPITIITDTGQPNANLVYIPYTGLFYNVNSFGSGYTFQGYRIELGNAFPLSVESTAATITISDVAKINTLNYSNVITAAMPITNNVISGDAIVKPNQAGFYVNMEILSSVAFKIVAKVNGVVVYTSPSIPSNLVPTIYSTNTFTPPQNGQSLELIVSPF